MCTYVHSYTVGELSFSPTCSVRWSYNQDFPVSFFLFFENVFEEVLLHNCEINSVDQAGLDPAEDGPASALLVLSSQTWALTCLALLCFF